MDKNALNTWKLLHFQNVASPVKCEICGKKLPTHTNALNLSFSAFIGVAGHPALGSFACPCSQSQSTEHWSCSIDCWKQMAINCIENDMIPILKEGLERIHGELSHTKEGLK